MQRAKISLSAEETALVLDPGWILTKRSVMEKVGDVLGQVSEAYRDRASFSASLPAELTLRFPKLSRGENYQGLPYLMLDYPAVFDKEHVFAVRTFFWWGHYVSLTLHLKGSYQRRFLPGILRGLEETSSGGGGSVAPDALGTVSADTWYVAVTDNEWSHTIPGGDYARFPTLSEAQRQALAHHPFFKIATFIPLDRWDMLESLLVAYFDGMMGMLEG